MMSLADENHVMFLELIIIINNIESSHTNCILLRMGGQEVSLINSKIL